MGKRTRWIAARIKYGWLFVAAGAVVGFTGVVLELFAAAPPFRPSLITGLGILFAGIGVGMVVRYRSALRDEDAARRLTIEEMDERTVMIRSQAAYRAFWVAMVLVYIGLMWTSFEGGLPSLSGDVLWFFLAAVLVTSFGVYVVGYILADRQN